jgi:hypothetical protein
MALLTAAAVAAPPVPTDVVFHGGALDGLVLRSSGDGAARPSALLWPSRANASRPAASAAAAVAGFLKAYRSGHRRDLAPFLAAGAASTVCQTIGYDACEADSTLNPFPFQEHCLPNSPYGIDDSSVRVEWLYQGKLYYVAWLQLRDGKIASISTHRASAPVLMN